MYMSSGNFLATGAAKVNAKASAKSGDPAPCSLFFFDRDWETQKKEYDPYKSF